MTDYEFVQEFFPDVDPQVAPYGEKVIVQYKLVRKRTAGGIVLVEDTRDVNRENTTMARVVSLGSIAFRNRDTGLQWTEGAWSKPGDIVLVPKWGGFRFNRKHGDDVVTFALFKDHEIICGPTGGLEELDEVL